mgnify:CR=1 FL=1
MIRFLLGLPARLKLWAVAILTAVAGVAAIYAKGRSDAAHKAELRDLKAQANTTEKVLHETASDDSADDIRKRMRERAGKP